MFDNKPTGYAPDKLAPHSSDSEEAVLGSVLINPDILLELLTFLLPEDFYIIRNSYVFQAIINVHERGEAVDYLTVIEELRTLNQLDLIGGAAYITYLINNTPTHIHAESYGRAVERASIRRRLLDAATKIGQLALVESSDIDELIDSVQGEVFEAVRRRQPNRPVSLAQVAAANFDLTEKRYQDGERGITGLPTGFDTLDTLLGGLQRGLYVILGRSKMGKTALMLSIVIAVARWLYNRGDSRRILYITLEEDITELTERLEVIISRINAHKLRVAAFNENDWDRYTGAHLELGRLPVDLLDMRGATDSEIRRAVELYSLNNPLALVFVDFLQQVRGTRTGKHGYSSEKRNIEVRDVAYSFADLGKSLAVPVVVAAQAKQDVKERNDKLPTEYDVQESDGVVQACTGLISFCRPHVYDKSRPADLAEMAVVANRKGPNGPIPNIAWHGETMHYYQRGNP